MPAVQPQYSTSAFQTRTAPAVLRANVPAVLPERPVSQPTAPTRTGSQTRPLFWIMACALLALIAGLVYVYGHAQITHEGYRRARLRQLLDQERIHNRMWKQKLAIAQREDAIAARALAIKMVPATEENTWKVPEGRSRK